MDDKEVKTPAGSVISLDYMVQAAKALSNIDFICYSAILLNDKQFNEFIAQVKAMENIPPRFTELLALIREDRRNAHE